MSGKFDDGKKRRQFLAEIAEKWKTPRSDAVNDDSSSFELMRRVSQLLLAYCGEDAEAKTGAQTKDLVVHLEELAAKTGTR